MCLRVGGGLFYIHGLTGDILVTGPGTGSPMGTQLIDDVRSPIALINMHDPVLSIGTMA